MSTEFQKSTIGTGLLVICLFWSGCTSINSTQPLTKRNGSQEPKTESLESHPKDKSQGVKFKTLSKGFEGSWVVELSCDSRNRRNNYKIKEYGLLEISKDGGSKYTADFSIFEDRQQTQSSFLNLENGAFIRMEGQSQNEGTEINLVGKEWLLKSNRKGPISFHGALKKNDFFIKGKVIGDPSCSDFLASKFPTNDTIEKDPIFTMGKSGFFAMITNKRNPPEPQDCIDLFNWVGSGAGQVVFKNTRLFPLSVVNSLFFDEENFIRHFGKTYRNWTEEDAKAYTVLFYVCSQINSQFISPEIQQRFRRMAHLRFLEVGKNKENERGSRVNPSKGDLKKPLPNMSWAANYFVLAAVKSARAYEQIILRNLNNLDSSDKSITTIKNHIKHNDFPFRFLPASNKDHFQRTVTALYKNRQNQNVEHVFLAFNPTQYPKTLEGLKTLLFESERLRVEIQSLSDQQKRDDLNLRYDTMLNDHSLAAGRDIISGVPGVDISPEGYSKLHQYVQNASVETSKYLQKQHQGEINKQLDGLLIKFIDQFYSAMDQWLAVNVVSGEAGIGQLNALSKLFFKRDFLNLKQSLNHLEMGRLMAKKIVEEAEMRQEECDQLAAHPQDNKKPYYYVGVSDELLNHDVAFETCITSLEKNINNPRYNFQLGRVLFTSQRFDEALPYLEEAAKHNYRPANYYLGVMKLEGHAGLVKNIDEAIVSFELSANDDFTPAIKFLQNYRSTLSLEDQKKLGVQRSYKGISYTLVVGTARDRPRSSILDKNMVMALVDDRFGNFPLDSRFKDFHNSFLQTYSTHCKGYIKDPVRKIITENITIYFESRFAENFDLYFNRSRAPDVLNGVWEIFSGNRSINDNLGRRKDELVANYKYLNKFFRGRCQAGDVLKAMENLYRRANNQPPFLVYENSPG